MLRIILTFLFLISLIIPGFSAEQWIVGRPLTGDNPVNYPAASLANNDSLDRLLANFREGMTLTYVNASSLSVSAGSIVCVDGSAVHYFRQNAGFTTINATNLDTGSSFNTSTTYYVYANCSANATTATFTISLNSSSPSGVTAYREIGTFTTDGSSNILPATVNQEINGYVTADAGGNKSLQGIFNYGSSSSSSTFVTGNVKLAYGTTGSMSFGSTTTISNLPFTSSSSYIAIASSASGNGSQNACSISSQAATTLGVTAVSVPAGGNVNITCNWMAIGT